MSYITSCLPLRGCRSLCTLESCNTPFPASLFLSSKWRQCLLSPSGSVRAFIYTNICIKHGGVTFSDAAQFFVGSGLLGRLQIDSNTCLVHLTLILFYFLQIGRKKSTELELAFVIICCSGIATKEKQKN